MQDAALPGNLLVQQIAAVMQIFWFLAITGLAINNVKDHLDNWGDWRPVTRTILCLVGAFMFDFGLIETGITNQAIDPFGIQGLGDGFDNLVSALAASGGFGPMLAMLKKYSSQVSELRDLKIEKKRTEATNGK